MAAGLIRGVAEGTVDGLFIISVSTAGEANTPGTREHGNQHTMPARVMSRALYGLPR